MALSKILENSITDGVISAAKLKDFAAAVDLNGVELILDADQDTSITADTDDQIDIKISGADDFRFTANTFTALAGSGIVVPDGGLTFGSTAISATAAEINLIDGGASTGTTAVADADGIITNDGGTMRLTTAATFKTYFQEGISTAYDDLTTGDAAVNIATSAGNITIDAQGNDTDIIFKGTDGGADKTFMTIDGSAGGDLFLTGGLIDLKNDGSAVSQIKFYCESSNAHAQTLIGAPHSESATNTLTLPSTGGNSYLLTAASTATLTNKTFTSPKINEDVAVTATATELNLLDGVSGLVQADLTKLAAVDSTAAEINLIDGGTARGTTAVADADGLLHNDGGTMRMTSAATFKTYFQEGISQAYDDFTVGDAAVNITTSAGDITIDAQGNDTDIIFKGTDGNADTTFLTIDGSAAGEATFNAGIVIADAGNIGSASDTDAIAIGSDGDVTLTQDLELQHDGAILSFGANDEVTLTHVHDTGILLNSTNVIQFNDASQNIGAPSATVLDINATDEIELNATLLTLMLMLRLAEQPQQQAFTHLQQFLFFLIIQLRPLILQDNQLLLLKWLEVLMVILLLMMLLVTQLMWQLAQMDKY